MSLVKKITVYTVYSSLDTSVQLTFAVVQKLLKTHEWDALLYWPAAWCCSCCSKYSPAHPFKTVSNELTIYSRLSYIC